MKNYKNYYEIDLNGSYATLELYDFQSQDQEFLIYRMCVPYNEHTNTTSIFKAFGMNLKDVTFTKNQLEKFFREQKSLPLEIETLMFLEEVDPSKETYVFGVNSEKTIFGPNGGGIGRERQTFSYHKSPHGIDGRCSVPRYVIIPKGPYQVIFENSYMQLLEDLFYSTLAEDGPSFLIKNPIKREDGCLELFFKEILRKSYSEEVSYPMSIHCILKPNNTDDNPRLSKISDTIPFLEKCHLLSMRILTKSSSGTYSLYFAKQEQDFLQSFSKDLEGNEINNIFDQNELILFSKKFELLSKKLINNFYSKIEYSELSVLSESK